jgi:hypothetical protein
MSRINGLTSCVAHTFGGPCTEDGRRVGSRPLGDDGLGLGEGEFLGQREVDGDVDDLGVGVGLQAEDVSAEVPEDLVREGVHEAASVLGGLVLEAVLAGAATP